MSVFSRFCLVFLCCSVSSLPAQTAAAVAHYVQDHNARVASYDWVKTARGPVSLAVNEANEIEATVGGDLRIVLQRDRADELDAAFFPHRLARATVLMTNTTVVIVDEAESVHLAFSLHDNPVLPELAGTPLMVFTGYGLGRHRLDTTE